MHVDHVVDGVEKHEGVAAIDPSGSFSDQRFPRGGTESHAALLLVDHLFEHRRATALADNAGPVADDVAGDRAAADDLVVGRGAGEWSNRAELIEVVAEISIPHQRRWRSEYVERPDKLTDAVVELLVDLRLAETSVDPAGSWRARLLPAAARFTSVEDGAVDVGNDGEPLLSAGYQTSLW